MPNKLLLIGLDGIPASVFNHLYDLGELPNIRNIFEDGLRIRNLVATFPTDSMTCGPLIFQGVNITSLDPVAQLCYDRITQRYQFAWDFFPVFRGRPPPIQAPSIFHRSDKSFVIGIREGKDARHYIPPFYFIFGSFLARLGPLFDSLVFNAFPRILKRYQTAAYWSTSCDHLAHSYGRLALKDALIGVDRKLGGLIKNIHPDTNLVLLSDHGSSPTHTYFDLAKIFRSHGFRVVDKLKNTNDVVLADSLLNYAFVYILGDPALVAETISQQSEVGVCAYRGQGEGIITVVNGQGKAEITRTSECFRYSPLDGDPFGYDIHLPVEWSAREWLDKTIDSQYPYGLVRLWQIFQNPQCGDLVLCFDSGSSPDWSFVLSGRLKIHAPVLKFRNNHGGLEREQLLTILLANGPDIAAETLDYALIEDVYPLLRQHCH